MSNCPYASIYASERISNDPGIIQACRLY